MELKDCRLTMLVGQDETTITFYDYISATQFFEVKLSPEQLSSALSRIGYTKCKSSFLCDQTGLERINKKQICKDFEFEISDTYNHKDRVKIACEIGKKLCPMGWQMDKSFNSQGSFFVKDGKNYARTIIRIWVDEKPGKGVENDTDNL